MKTKLLFSLLFLMIASTNHADTPTARLINVRYGPGACAHRAV